MNNIVKHLDDKENFFIQLMNKDFDQSSMANAIAYEYHNLNGCHLSKELFEELCKEVKIIITCCNNKSPSIQWWETILEYLNITQFLELLKITNWLNIWHNAIIDPKNNPIVENLSIIKSLNGIKPRNKSVMRVIDEVDTMMNMIIGKIGQNTNLLKNVLMPNKQKWFETRYGIKI